MSTSIHDSRYGWLLRVGEDGTVLLSEDVMELLFEAAHHCMMRPPHHIASECHCDCPPCLVVRRLREKIGETRVV